MEHNKWNLLTKISTGIGHHLAQLENLAAVVFASYRVLLKHTGHSIICHQIVSNKSWSKVRKSDWVFYEDCIVLGSAHQSALIAKRKFVNFNWTPRFNLTSIGTRRCIRPRKLKFSDFLPFKFLLFYLTKYCMYFSVI